MESKLEKLEVAGYISDRTKMVNILFEGGLGYN